MQERLHWIFFRDWFALKMEVLCSFEILETNIPVTQCYIPEDLTHPKPKPSLLRVKCCYS